MSEGIRKDVDAEGAFSTLIIGTGFAGLCMGIKLRKAGREDFVILEKADRIGGTWRDNTYPGSGCDVPSFLYSFSFDPKTDWTRRFAEQPEILDYMDDCAERHGLLPHIRFGVEVASAEFDDETSMWRVRTTDGRTFTARFLVAGCGQLNRPLFPAIAGMDRFKGKTFHSARWDHDHDLTGERVAVIGNGASAVQFVPTVAEKAARMTLFQRSAYWIMPKPDAPYTSLERRLLTRHRILFLLYRFYIYAMLEVRWPVFSSESWMGPLVTRSAMKHLRDSVADPELRGKLTPDYRLGCKRILISNDYYPALARENVGVVTDHVTEITEDAVITADGTRYPVDTIIYGTGFETTTFLAPISIRGREGLDLRHAWRRGAEAYLGVTVAGFPNLFLLYGPNTNLGHNSIIFMIECQADYILKCMAAAERGGCGRIEVRDEPMRTYNEEVQSRLKSSVWDSGCTSWYKNDSGRITNNWAWSTLTYWRRMRRPDLSAFSLDA